MIGVIANLSDHAVVRELFELFKTPWEFYRSRQQYDVLLCTEEARFDFNSAKMVVIYGGRKLTFDDAAGIELSCLATNPGEPLFCSGYSIPIYGKSVTFPGGTGVAVREEPRETGNRSGPYVVRIGYDLLVEIRALLTGGQPEANAAIPAMELHIALLRKLINNAGLPLIEIPPVPAGYRLIACLTHDVDHPSIRLHKLDHTLLGFLYRSIFGSLIDAFRGRGPWSAVFVNWAAAARLPFIYLGLDRDIWNTFTLYLKLENGFPSSFFVIPFKDHPGWHNGAAAPSRRAARYCAAELKIQIAQLMSAGCEVGLHGIDAWLDASMGRKELEQVRQITNLENVGVRMHWLYFDERSPVALEQAGAYYDSSVGYNGTVGYRAGTTQVYRPLSADRLLELPLHIMDTALFFPSHLHLSPGDARREVRQIVATAARFGGVVTVNWHVRSLAPERLWGVVYADLIEELKHQGAWFATATQAVAWFHKRRSVVLESIRTSPEELQESVAAITDNLPDLQIRVHHASPASRNAPVAAFVA